MKTIDLKVRYSDSEPSQAPLHNSLDQICLSYGAEIKKDVAGPTGHRLKRAIPDRCLTIGAEGPLQESGLRSHNTFQVNDLNSFSRTTEVNSIENSR